MTDDEIEALAKKHICPHHDRLDSILPNRFPYQQTEQFRRVKALITDVLSKMRAPVAGDKFTHNDDCARYLASAPVADAAPEYAYSDDGRTVTMTNADRAPGYWASAPVGDDLAASLRSMASVAPASECEILLAAASALASAPVAGEAQPVAWMIYASDTHQLKRIVTTDPGDTAAFGCLKMPLYAAPQASEADKPTSD